MRAGARDHHMSNVATKASASSANLPWNHSFELYAYVFVGQIRRNSSCRLAAVALVNSALSVACELCARRQSALVKNATDVRIHRALRDRKSGGDLAIPMAACDQCRDLPLSGG